MKKQQSGGKIPYSDPEALRTYVQQHSDALLARAENANLLYYFLTIFNLWGPVGPVRSRSGCCSGDFIRTANEATQRLVIDKAASGAALSPHDLLFLFQLNFEAKAFYAVLRNLIRICLCQAARPEPWEPGDKGVSGPSTVKVIKSVLSDMRAAGFHQLAEVFETTHGMDARTIRNAVAHATFLLPTSETQDEWVFAGYSRDGAGAFVMHDERWPHDRFQAFMKRFLAVRLGFLAAVHGHLERYSNRSLRFQAPNQMKPTEILDCEFDGSQRQLKVKYRGTPLW